MKLKLIFTFALIAVVIAVTILVGLMGMVYWKETHLPDASDYNVLVILGCQVKSDGTLSLQLQYRLQKAFDEWVNKQCPIIVCGGQGTDEPMTEAEAMYRWLKDHGVPEEQILKEDQSVNTRENLGNALKMMEAGNLKKAAIITSDYHVARAISLASDIGMDAVGIGAPTLGGYHWVKNRSREGLSWVKYWMEKYILRK